ncbi:MAG: N-acyl homoserine lactonase family protein [Propionibacteriaceae bacterium]|jgi:glyoxylase-like metal-dependent hydrolase (beta-lactamase superfamily II)|nr:N-acyl homoserine lactonase family protein [Propionibacteriaceae bacterium]
MTSTWTIEPMAFGEFPEVELSGYTYSKNQGVKRASPALSFLLRSPQRMVLVDTGPAQRDQDHHPSHVQLRRSPDFGLDVSLERLGVAPGDIDTIVITHLHYDHACNLDRFPRAKIYLQAEELRAAVDPITHQKAMYEFGLEDFVPSWVRASWRVERVRGDFDLADGLRLLLLPGHTPGMQSVLVQTESGPHLLASDIISSYDNLDDGAGGWAYPGIHTDLVACERSLEKIRSLGAVVVPSHDWRVMDPAWYPGH